MIIILTAKKPSLPSASVTAVWLFSLFLLGYFLKSPALASKSVTEALRVCASGLIPSLFPFIVLTGIMNGSGMANAAARLLGKPIGILLGMPQAAAYAVVLGALGGFPIGAVCTRALYERGALSREEAERLCSYTNNAGPAFCIGGIGAAMFGDTAIGVRLYLCQLAAAMILGILQRRRTVTAAPPDDACDRPPVSDILTSAVTQGGLTMLKICSFAVFFAIIGDAACMAASRFFGDTGTAVIASLCELTLAGRRCAALGGMAAQILAGFAVGYAGLSVHMQVTSILSGSTIRLGRYHVCKLLQGILTAALMLAAAR